MAYTRIAAERKTELVIDEEYQELVVEEYQEEVGEAFRKKFEDLANSRSEFKNVGMLKSKHGIGSGVYIAPRVVVTAASCLPNGFSSNAYILPDSPQITFSIEDKKGETQTARVMLGTRYPDYQDDYHKGVLIRPSNDIALLLLDHEFKNIDPIKVNLSSSQDEGNCINVGYTNQYVTPLYKDKRMPIFTGQQLVKIATKFPSLPYASQLGLHVSTLGYPSSSFVDSCCCLSLTYTGIDKLKPNNDPFEIGVYEGLSGGGYFNRHSLLGITVLHVPEGSYEKGFSNQFLDNVYCLPLSYHGAWIKKTMNMFKKQLPELDRKLEAWNKETKAKPESKKAQVISVQEEKEKDYLQKITGKFSGLLIDFQETHLHPKDKKLNKMITQFLSKEYSSLLDNISEIKNALLMKGYSIEQPSFFRRHNNIISDIQKIIDIANDIIKHLNESPEYSQRSRSVF